MLKTMKKTQKNQNGFGLVEALLLIIAVALVVFVGYYVWHTQKQTDKTLNQAAKVSDKSAQPVKLDTYVDPVANYSLKYPDSWKVKTTLGTQANQPTSQTSMTSPSGQAINLRTWYGGLGGACPETNGTPFSPANICPTNEYKLVENTGKTTQDFTDPTSGTIGSLPLYLVERIVGNPNDEHTQNVNDYVINLEEDQGGSPSDLINKPQIGLYTDFSDISYYINSNKFYDIDAYAVNNSPNFFSSSSGQEVKTILSSIDLENVK